MDILGIHHVAFSQHADEITSALSSLFGLGVATSVPNAEFVEEMLPVGGCYLQALTPTGPGVVQRSVDRRGSGLHHVALQVADIDTALAELRVRDARLIDAHARAGDGGSRIAFVHPASVGGLLVELLEVATFSSAPSER